MKRRDEQAIFAAASAGVSAFERSLTPQFKRLIEDIRNASAVASAKVLNKRLDVLRAAAFDPDQPRDKDGKFAPTGGGDESGGDAEVSTHTLEQKFQKAGKEVDGRVVLDRVPNEGSISSSLDEYTVLPGVREVHMSDMDPDYKVGSYSKSENERVDILTRRIAESKEIAPLIIVIDKEKYPYVLEGGHRYDALRKLGARSFPAKIVIDTSSVNLRGAVRAAAYNPPRASIGGFSFDKSNPKAVQWVLDHATETIDGLSATTREDIKTLIEESMQGEFDVDTLTDEITDLIGDAERAEVIARTETMRASNEGQQQAWDQAAEDGYLTGNEEQEWIVTPDDRLCPECEPFDGETAELGGTFSAEGIDSDGPPLHPRCRCTLGLKLGN